MSAADLGARAEVLSLTASPIGHVSMFGSVDDFLERWGQESVWGWRILRAGADPSLAQGVAPAIGRSRIGVRTGLVPPPVRVVTLRGARGDVVRHCP